MQLSSVGRAGGWPVERPVTRPDPREQPAPPAPSPAQDVVELSKERESSPALQVARGELLLSPRRLRALATPPEEALRERAARVAAERRAAEARAADGRAAAEAERTQAPQDGTAGAESATPAPQAKTDPRQEARAAEDAGRVRAALKSAAPDADS